jgi:hypothetical protein
MKRSFCQEQSSLSRVAIFSIKRIKWLSVVVFLSLSLSVQTYSTTQVIELSFCCGQLNAAKDASEQRARLITCLMESQWIEEFDERVATAHRILRFVGQGTLEITTIFAGGFAESEEAKWDLSSTMHGYFLGIDDPVLGERIVYRLKMTDLGIQLTEPGRDGESTHYYRAPIPSLISY